MPITEIGSKVSFERGGKWIDALVTGPAPSTSHAHMRVRLRVGMRSPLTGQYIINDLPTPVLVSRLHWRYSTIEELDSQIDAIIAAHAPQPEIDEEARLASLEQHWQDRKAIERNLPIDYRQLF